MTTRYARMYWRSIVYLKSARVLLGLIALTIPPPAVLLGSIGVIPGFPSDRVTV